MLGPTKCAVLFTDIVYYNITLTTLRVSIPYGIIIRDSLQSSSSQNGTSNPCTQQKDVKKSRQVKILAFVVLWILVYSVAQTAYLCKDA
jgi:hypothetical protein